MTSLWNYDNIVLQSEITMKGGVIIKTKQTTLRMPENLSSILKETSTKKRLCQNSLILNILWEWVEKNIEN